MSIFRGVSFYFMLPTGWVGRWAKSGVILNLKISYMFSKGIDEIHHFSSPFLPLQKVGWEVRRSSLAAFTICGDRNPIGLSWYEEITPVSSIIAFMYISYTMTTRCIFFSHISNKTINIVDVSTSFQKMPIFFFSRSHGMFPKVVFDLLPNLWRVAGSC